MEAASNGGLLYHEVQEGKLCAVHCVNTALQGPFFSEFDLAALAADLDQRERLVMLEGSRSPGEANPAAGDFFAEGEGSHNVSLGGDFSIQVSPGPPGPGFMEIILLGFLDSVRSTESQLLPWTRLQVGCLLRSLLRI
jgi:ataxin-3